MAIAEKIQRILEDGVSSGREVGLQCAVYEAGREVASCAAGWCDDDKQRQMAPETLIPVFSTGKALLSIAALRILDRLAIPYSTRLCDIWPEFSGEGREQVTLSHVLSHTSGMFCLPHADTPAQFVDWHFMCEALCRMHPSYPPGTRTKYQAFTYSWLLGEPLQRLTGKALRDIIRDEVLEPAGVPETECAFGLSAEQSAGLARIVRRPGFLPPLPPKGNFYNPTERMMTEPLVLQACLPAFNCCATARALGRIGAALIDREHGLLPEEVLRNASTLHRPAGEPIPEEIGRWDVFGYGFILYDRQMGRPGCFGHGGYAGAELIIDRERRCVFAFSRNCLTMNNDAKISCIELFNRELCRV